MPVPAAILSLIDPAKEYPAAWPPIQAHPVIDLPTEHVLIDWGQEISRKFLWERHWRIERMATDPFHFGYVPPHWKLCESQFGDGCKILLIMGGNRSGKSRYAAWKLMQTLCSEPGKRAWAFQTTGPNSIEMQQPYVHEYIPAEWKTAKKGQITDISYRRKTGFSESTFILPNESQCWFRNYAQDITTIEGGEVDMIWFDELVPLDWVETAYYRLVTRNGLMVITFTPIEGYSPTVKDFLQGAKTIRSSDADLLPIDPANPARGFHQVPVLQHCLKGGRRIAYFHTAWNPFSGWDRLRETLVGASVEEIKCRAYGVPTKSIQNRFPKFNEDVHVIDPARIPTKGTWYHVVDPCNGRNFFKIWATVIPTGQIIVAREWPQVGDYIPGIGDPGPWAIPDGKLADGKRGPAQKPMGLSLRQYVEEINRVESELATAADLPAITVAERRMDSRFGNTPTLQKDSTTTLIEQFADLDIHFTPAAGEHQQEGIDLINDALFYKADQPVGPLNQPRILIASCCTNTIFALKEWTGADGKHGASKDPIDVLRYLILADPIYIDDTGPAIQGGGSY
jgi:phage terminase large subunit-like protein